jgi:hypothetical protein
MRWLLLIGLIVAPAIARASPSVAIAPLDGDKGNKVAAAVVKAAGDDVTVTGPKETGKAMDKLGLSGVLDKKDQKKLRAKLEVDILIQGTVEGEGNEKNLELSLAGKGIKASKIKLRFKSATSSSFKKELREALSKRLTPGESDDEDEDKPKRLNDEDKPKHRDDEDKPKHRDDEDKPKHKRVSEDDEVSVHKKRRKHKSDDDDDEEAPRNDVTQVAIRLNAGAGFGRRGLDYEATGAAAPPPVGTAAPSARVEAEAYPGAMSTLKGIAAGLGIYGEYDRTIGVSIKVPQSGGKSAAIEQSHYAIGARYRVAFGTSTFAAGVGYAGRKYTADRGSLGTTVLDMPDVRYKAIAPNAVARFAATPTVGVFFGATFLLLLDAGPIATNANFGFAKTLAFEGAGGADIEISKGYGLRIAAEVNQVGFSFKNTVRGVSSATDRTIGLVASFEVLY